MQISITEKCPLCGVEKTSEHKSMDELTTRECYLSELSIRAYRRDQVVPDYRKEVCDNCAEYIGGMVGHAIEKAEGWIKGQNVVSA